MLFVLKWNHMNPCCSREIEQTLCDMQTWKPETLQGWKSTLRPSNEWLPMDVFVCSFMLNLSTLFIYVWVSLCVVTKCKCLTFVSENLCACFCLGSLYGGYLLGGSATRLHSARLSSTSLSTFGSAWVKQDDGATSHLHWASLQHGHYVHVLRCFFTD